MGSSQLFLVKADSKLTNACQTMSSLGIVLYRWYLLWVRLVYLSAEPNTVTVYIDLLQIYKVEYPNKGKKFVFCAFKNEAMCRSFGQEKKSNCGIFM
jgi:hypothetical protein